MNDSQDIVRAFRPLVRRWPLLILGICLGLFYSWNQLAQRLPYYQSRASLKISDRTTSESEYLKEFDPFLWVYDYLDVLALMRSDYMLGKAVDRLGMKVWIYEDELSGQGALYYPDFPFELDFSPQDSNRRDQAFQVEIRPDSQWTVSGEWMWKPWRGAWQDTLVVGENRYWLNEFPKQTGRFHVAIPSQMAMIEDLGNMDDLLIRLQNEKAPIINIYTWHENAAMAADFGNAIAAAYLADFAETKRRQARMALEQSMDQVLRTEHILDSLERRISQIEQDYNVNDLGAAFSFRFLQQLEIEQYQLNMNLELDALDQVWGYLQEDKLADGILPAFEAVKDARLRQDLQKLLRKTREAGEIREILTDKHPAVISRDEEVKKLRRQILRNVTDTRRTRQLDNAILGEALAKNQQLLLKLPAARHTLNALYDAYESWILRLLELETSRTEAYIATISSYQYHRQIEFAFPAAEPLKPQAHVLYSVYGLMGLFWTCFVLIALEMLLRPLRSPLDLEEYTHLPYWGQLPKKLSQETVHPDFMARAVEWISEEELQVWALTSYKHQPSQVEMAIGMARALSQLGMPTLIVETDLVRPQLAERIDDVSLPGIMDVAFDEDVYPEPAFIEEYNISVVPIGYTEGGQNLPIPFLRKCISKWRGEYAFIILLAPILAEAPEAATSQLPVADSIGLILRQDQTPLGQVKRASRFLGRYKLPATGWLVIR